MDAVEVLKKARDLWLEHPTTCVFARRSDGTECEPGDDDAVCWCAMGALDAVATGITGDVYLRAVSALQRVASKELLTSVEVANDEGRFGSGHWDAAIRSLGGEP